MSMKALNEAFRRPSVQMPKMTNVVSDKFGQLGQWASNQGAQWQGYGQYITNTDFGQKVLVMNPMHMVQLSSKTKSRMVKIVEFCRSASEKWFSHWLLLVVLIMYALIGAWIFVMIEGSAEMNVKGPVIDVKEKIKKDMWYFTHTNKVSRSQLDSIIDDRLEEYEKQLYINFKGGAGNDSSTIRWTFWSAVVYCFTVFTTIGYGHIAPVTRIGRITTIIYACIGIPLLLMVLADLGRLFTRSVKYLLKSIRSVIYSKKLKGVRTAGRRATAAQQNIAQTLKSHGLKFMADVKERRNSSRNNSTSVEDGMREEGMEGLEGRTHPVSTEPPAVTITAPTTPFLHPVATTVTGPNGQPIVILSPGISPSGRSSPLAGAVPIPGTPILDEAGNVIGGTVDDEFNLPVSLALTILFLYMLLGALIFMNTDGWHFVDAIYFVFISISTVGFGDLTPESEWSMIALSIYLLFGLALTSMCINVIQEQLAVAFEEAKLRLGNTMGFEITDPTQQDGGSGGSHPGAASSSSTGEKGESGSGTRIKTRTTADPSHNKMSDRIGGGGITNIKAPDIRVDTSFDLQKEAIGKSWKEKRDNKKKKPDPVPETGGTSFSSFADQYQTRQTPVTGSSGTQQQQQQQQRSLDPNAPPLTPRRSRSPRRSVNFSQ